MGLDDVPFLRGQGTGLVENSFGDINISYVMHQSAEHQYLEVFNGITDRVSNKTARNPTICRMVAEICVLVVIAIDALKSARRIEDQLDCY